MFLSLFVLVGAWAWAVNEEGSSGSGTSNVAKIGETEYATLAEAVNAAQTKDEIVLTADVKTESQIEVSDKEITLDLNGHKVSYTGETTLKSGVILVHNGAGLTVKGAAENSEVSAGTNAYAAIAVFGNGDETYEKLTIESGTYTGSYYAIVGNGTCHNTDITINGGTFTATYQNDNLAIYHPQAGNLTITGGEFTGHNTAIELRSGNLKISGGKFTATASPTSVEANGNGTTTFGAAIGIAQHTTKKDINVEITDGEFNGYTALAVLNPQKNETTNVNATISGGTFNGTVTGVKVEHGTMNIKGGTINGNGGFGVYVSKSIVNISDNAIVNSQEFSVGTGLGTGATINVSGGTLTAKDNAVFGGNGSNREGEPSKFNISGGTFNGGIITPGYVACGIYAPWKDEFNITGGTFNINGGAGVVARAGVVKISDGAVFNCTGNTVGKVGDSRVVVPCSPIVFDSEANYPAMTDDSKITITGGTFNSEAVVAKAILKDKDSVKRIEISGGTFSSLPYGSLIANDLDMIQNEDGTWTFGGEDYTSLAATIAAATENSTITIANNIAVSKKVIIDKSLKIDLNGKNIIGANDRVFNVTNGDVTIEGPGTISVPKAYVTDMDPSSSVIRIGDNDVNGTVSLTIGENVLISTDHSYGVTIFGSKTTETLTVNGRIETTDVPAVSGNGSTGYGNTTITINGTVKTTNENAIYHPQSGNLTINGTVIGKGGIEAKAGATTVAIGSKALIEATAETTVHEPNGNGCSTSGYAIAVVENKGYAGSASVDIQGGTIKGKIAIVDDDSDTANNTGKIVIKDGLFSEKPAPEYIAEGLIAYAQEDGKYIIKKSEVSTDVAENVKLSDGSGNISDEQKETVIAAVKEVVTNNDAVSSFGDTNTQNAISTDKTTEDNKTLIDLLKEKAQGTETPEISAENITTSVSISLVEAKVTTNEGEERPIVEEMVFNIKPIATVTVGEQTVKTEVPNELITGTIKFRLPVDKRVTKKTVEMFHKADGENQKKEFLGLFPVLVDENGNKYVEVEVTSFSEYSYVLNDAVLMNAYRVKDGVSGSEYVKMAEEDWTTFLSTNPNAVAVVSSDNVSFASTAKNVIVEYDNDGVKTYVCPNFVLTDKKDFYSPVKFIAKAGYYSRQPNKSLGGEYASVEYNSVCLPFALSASQLSQTAKILALAYYDGQKTVYFSEGTEVNAGVPCLIYDTADSWSTITFSNTEIVATPDNHGNIRGTFVATSEYQYSESNPCYTITKTNQFGQAPSSLVSFRSCLFLQHNVTIGQEPTASEQSKLVRSVIGGDDEEGTTAIEDVNAAEEESTGVIYNLNGQKVGTSIKSLPRGIYIKNGKKISVN